MTIEVTPVVSGPGGMATYIDYTIDLPTASGADIRSASGAIDARGLRGALRLESASGDIDAHDLAGALSATTASGAIRAANIGGDAQLRSISGTIRAAGIDRLAEARTTSGEIDVNGTFLRGAQISSTSGDVTARVPLSTAISVDASSFSGDVSSNLPLTNRSTGPHRLTGALAGGGPPLTIHTTSGAIRLLSSS